MSKVLFESVQADILQSFIDVQRLRGYTYKHQSHLLGHFDHYLCECGYRCVWLEQAVVEAYIGRRSKATAYSQSTMLSVIRGYSRFLHMRYPQSYVLQMLPMRAKRPSRFYIYSQEEITALMAAAAALGPDGSIRSHTVRTLIGLLYVTGLRISEALNLSEDDLDRSQRVLFVRKGKFGKDRYVALADSTVKALLEYRQKSERIRKDGAIFVSTKGTRVAAVTIGNLFRKLLHECGIASAAPWPRLHDLRHTYAVNCLCKWYKQGKDVNALLPVLSTAMGHVKVSCTQIYLHVPAELSGQAADRFAEHVQNHLPER